MAVDRVGAGEPPYAPTLDVHLLPFRQKRKPSLGKRKDAEVILMFQLLDCLVCLSPDWFRTLGLLAERAHRMQRKLCPWMLG